MNKVAVQKDRAIAAFDHLSARIGGQVMPEHLEEKAGIGVHRVNSGKVRHRFLNNRTMLLGIRGVVMQDVIGVGAECPANDWEVDMKNLAVNLDGRQLVNKAAQKC